MCHSLCGVWGGQGAHPGWAFGGASIGVTSDDLEELSRATP